MTDAEVAPELAAALAGGGLPIVEISMRTDAAPAAMRKIAASGVKVTLMAGTITTPEQAKLALDSGAELIVSPGLNTRVVEHCLRHDYGLKYLKFFPAEAYGGVKTLKALQDVYSAFAFMATSGVNAQNLADYLEVPIVMACGGSWLAPGDLVAQRNFDAIQGLVKEAVGTVAALTR
jgi:2-dehydro-3-deoxyphosphogluconate aldolase / (4S)-4-hydroxy-2-oxoglutarate aldolase